MFFTLNPQNDIPDRGPGYCKFNTMFLQNTEYVSLIKQTIKDELLKMEQYDDKGFVFDYLKMKIRDVSMTFAKQFHAERKKLETELTSMLQNLSNEHALSGSVETLDTIDGIKRELEQIQS